MMPIQEFNIVDRDYEVSDSESLTDRKECELTETQEDDKKVVKFDHLDLSSQGDQHNNHSHVSLANSVASDDLFADGLDDILYQGELLKFKPGISANFVSRYVQIS